MDRQLARLKDTARFVTRRPRRLVTMSWTRYQESASESWPPSASEERVTPFSRYPLQDAWQIWRFSESTFFKKSYMEDVLVYLWPQPIPGWLLQHLGLHPRCHWIYIPFTDAVAVFGHQRNVGACAARSGAQVDRFILHRWRFLHDF